MKKPLKSFNSSRSHAFRVFSLCRNESSNHRKSIHMTSYGDIQDHYSF